MGLFTASSLACALAQNIAVLDGARAVQGIGGGDALRELARHPRGRVPRHRPSGRRPSPSTAQRSEPRSPSARSSAAPSPAASAGRRSSTSTCRSASSHLSPASPGSASPTTRRHAGSTGPDRQRSRPACSCSYSRSCAETRTAGRAPASSPSSSAADCSCSRSCSSSGVPANRCSRSALFRNRAFTGAQVAAFSISASFFALFLYLTLYLQEVLHLSPSRHRPGLPAGHDPDVRRLRGQRTARRPHLAGRPDHRRPDPRCRRPCA